MSIFSLHNNNNNNNNNNNKILQMKRDAPSTTSVPNKKPKLQIISNETIEKMKLQDLTYLFIGNQDNGDNVGFHNGPLSCYTTPKREDRNDVDEWFMKSIIAHIELWPEHSEEGTIEHFELLNWVFDMAEGHKVSTQPESTLSGLQPDQREPRTLSTTEKKNEDDDWNLLQFEDRSGIFLTLKEKFPESSAIETIKKLTISKWKRFVDTGSEEISRKTREETAKFTEENHCIFVRVNYAY
jgi:hypothetical protein